MLARPRYLFGALLVGLAVMAQPASAIEFTALTSPESAHAPNLLADGGAVYTLSGHRVFKSEDAATWTQLPAPSGRLPDHLAVSAGRISVIADERVMSSTDDGASWTDITGEFAGSLNRVWAANGQLFVYTFELTANFQALPRLYRWSGSGTDYTEVTPPGVEGVTQLVGAGSNLCAAVGNAGLRWSADGGDSWNTSSGVNGQAPVLGVSPDGLTVLASSSSSNTTVRRSLNSCQNFGQLGSVSSSGGVRALGVDAAGDFYVGFDSGVVKRRSGSSAFEDANSGSLPAGSGISIGSLLPFGNAMLAGTAGLGVHSNAAGDWASANDGLFGSAISRLLALDGGADAMGLAQAGGYFVSADASGTAFSARNTGLELRNVNDVLRLDDGTLLAATQGFVDFSSFPATGTPGLFRSIDGGSTWVQADAASSGLPTGASLNALASDGTVVFASVSNVPNGDQPQGIYRSLDGGVSWSADANLSGTRTTVRNMAQRGSTVWFYLANTGVVRTQDGGASIRVVNSGLDGSKFGRVFAGSSVLIASAGGNTVYYSTDDGDTWSAAEGFAVSRFGIELLSMAEDADGVLYLGDEHAGLSISTDNGRTWAPDSDGLPQAETCIPRINALLARNGKVYAGTGGSSLFVADVLGGGAVGDSVPCTTAIDSFPNGVSFNSVENVSPDTVQTSNTVTVSGLGAGVSIPVGVSGGEYSLGCTDAGFTSAAGTATNGDTLCLRHTSASIGETEVLTTLRLGDTSAGFSSRTGLVFTGREDEINTNYGTNGFATLASSGSAASVLIADDGSHFVGGNTAGFQPDMVVDKLNPDGSPASDFGTGGRVTVDLPGRSSLAKVLRQPDGKLVLVGYRVDDGPTSSTSDNFAVVVAVRLNPDGSRDTGFGTDGVVEFDINPAQTTQRTELVGSGALLSDGAILAVGGVVTNGNGVHYFAVRFAAADGAVDTDFGVAHPDFAVGTANIQVGSSAGAIGKAVVLQADGRIVIAGQAQNGFSSVNGVVARLNADGSVDTGFGSTGSVSVPGATDLKSIAGLSDGRFLVAGTAVVDRQFRPLTARITAAGAVDASYGDNGVMVLDSVNGSFNAALLLADGRVAAVGTTAGQSSGSPDLLYTVLSADGALDAGFGTNGQGYVERRPVNGSRVAANTAALRADGGVLMVGSFGNSPASFVFGGGDSAGPVEDSVPNAFSFEPVAGVDLTSEQISAVITISGINVPTDFSVSGGELSLNGGPFSAAAGTLVNGDTVQLRHTASGDFATAVSTTATVGGVSASFTSTTRAADTTPEAFSFADQSGVELSAVVVSDAVQIAGIEAAAAISVEGGEYAIGCDSAAFTSQPGTVANGQSVCVRHTAAATEETATNTTLSIGGVSDTFTSITRGAVILDSTPDAFAFVDVSNVARASVQVSNAVTIRGIDTAAQITVEGGEYAIGCDANAFRSTAGTVNNGQSVCVRHTAAAAYDSVTNTVLIIGGVRDTFSSTTGPDPANGSQQQVNSPSGRPVAVRSSTGLIEDLTNNAEPPAGSSPPAGVAFEDGYFSFRITGLPVGGSSIVSLTLPSGSQPDTYYKVIGGQYVEFLFDGSTGARISGNTVTLHLVDGGRGDADGVANGVIVDPGAPASLAPTTARVSTGGALPSGLLALLAAWLLRQRSSVSSASVRRRPVAGWRSAGLLLVLCWPMMASAQWSGGLRAGSLDQFLGAADLQQALARRGHTVSVSARTEATGISAYAAYALQSNLALELAYNHLPAADYQLTGVIADAPRLTRDLAQEIAGQGDALSLSVRVSAPLAGERWLFMPRLGIAVARSEVSLHNAGQTHRAAANQTGLVLGLATQYRLTPALSLGAGWDLYRYGGQANLGFWHLGLDWRVGAGL